MILFYLYQDLASTQNDKLSLISFLQKLIANNLVYIVGNVL